MTKVSKLNFSSQITEVKNRYQFITPFLTDDFIPYIPEYDAGVDFILYRDHDDLLLKIQLKSRWTIDKRYFRRNIWIAFPNLESVSVVWYLMPHDLMVEQGRKSFGNSKSWANGGYSCPGLTRNLIAACEQFRLPEFAAKLNREFIEALRTRYAAGWSMA